MAIYSRENTCFFERKKHTVPMTMTHAHYHDTHELYFLEQGQTKYFIGNEIFMLEPGDMIFIPKFVFHKTDNGQHTNVERLRFSFDDEFIGTEYRRHLDFLKQKRFIRIPSENLPELKSIISLLESENEKKEGSYKEMKRLCFIQMLILISRYCTTNTPDLSDSEQLVQSIATYISRNYGQPLNLDMLSHKYAVSHSHLSRLFKKVTGIGISEYINLTRITAAEKLLRCTKKSITLIASECGFGDSNYFAAVFKKYKGITPKRYALEKYKGE